MAAIPDAIVPGPGGDSLRGLVVDDAMNAQLCGQGPGTAPTTRSHKAQEGVRKKQTR
jgi:hypothetical protein